MTLIRYVSMLSQRCVQIGGSGCRWVKVRAGLTSATTRPVQSMNIYWLLLANAFPRALPVRTLVRKPSKKPALGKPTNFQRQQALNQINSIWSLLAGVKRASENKILKNVSRQNLIEFQDGRQGKLPPKSFRLAGTGWSRGRKEC